MRFGSTRVTQQWTEEARQVEGQGRVIEECGAAGAAVQIAEPAWVRFTRPELLSEPSRPGQVNMQVIAIGRAVDQKWRGCERGNCDNRQECPPTGGISHLDS